VSPPFSVPPSFTGKGVRGLGSYFCVLLNGSLFCVLLNGSDFCVILERSEESRCPPPRVQSARSSTTYCGHKSSGVNCSPLCAPKMYGILPSDTGITLNNQNPNPPTNPRTRSTLERRADLGRQRRPVWTTESRGHPLRRLWTTASRGHPLWN
jgi:hypothetical protein